MQDQQESCCCPKGSWPALESNYKGTGERLDIGGTSTYHVGSSDRVLVLIEDIFGASSARHESVADTYASWGYNVYLPQLLDKACNGTEDIPAIVANIKAQNYANIEARFKAVLDYLHAKGYKNIYGAGFCWGVWQAFKFSIKFDAFRAIVGFHPSLMLGPVFGQTEVSLAEGVKCPVFFVPAGNDPANVKEGGELVKIVEGRFGSDKVQTKEFPEQSHGWVVRGDVSNPAVYKGVEEALRLSKEYLAKL